MFFLTAPTYQMSFATMGSGVPPGLPISSKDLNRHLAHQTPEFACHARPAGSLPPGDPGPEEAESSRVPADDRLRSYQKQRFSPTRPKSREGDLEPTVSRSQPGPWALPLHHSQLLSEGQILQGQFFKMGRVSHLREDRKHEPEHGSEYPVCSAGKSILARRM